MKTITFITGNSEKYDNAVAVCSQYNIKVIQKELALDEIQNEDPELVARDKASKAFHEVSQPIVTTDDSWSIPALNGFPGVYMHSMNHWLTLEDFLRLTLPLKNRDVILTQYLIYQAGTKQKVFKKQSAGTLLKEIRGTSQFSNHTITAMPLDNGMSLQNG